MVEHVFRSGDLNFDYFSSYRAIDGIRAHQHVQQNRPNNYQAEVSVSFCHESSNYSIELGGRIDGVMLDGGKPVLEEIKTTSQDTDQMVDRKDPVHWGQLKTYAFIYGNLHNVSEMVGQLTYVNPENWKMAEFKQSFDMAELKIFFADMIHSYQKWAEHQIIWEEVRNQSVNALKFPYDHYRPGQRQMAVAVYRTIVNQDNILIQAPTGIGKTMAAVFPALKTFGRQGVGKLFYLTARTTGKTVVERVYELLEQNGLKFKVVTLTAKAKICFCPEKNCHPEACRFAKGYYDRLNDAIWEGLTFNRLHQDIIASLARKFSICPFEFSLDISQWADGIICDYNYVFDPRVFLRRYFSENEGRQILLIDEAHNLVDRSREMFSAKIDKKPLLILRRLIKGKLIELYRCLTGINRWFLTCRRKAPQEAQEWSDTKLPLELLTLMNQFVPIARKWLRLNIPTSYRDTLLEHYFNILWFLRVAEAFDGSYTICYTKKEDQVRVKLFCIDPSHQLAQVLKKGLAAVFFSATLTPIHYFRFLFGCDQDTKRLILPSPFPPENFAVFRAGHIATYYYRRENSKISLCKLLWLFTQNKQGNYLIFFPSYAYLNMIHALYLKAAFDTDVIAQRSDMSELDRKTFLNRFKSENSRTLVGFAVLGGIFGEGIDLVGDRLCGVAVIGVGLPGITLERELIRRYYEDKEKQGFEFAYQFPGVNRVLQAAGRVIRTEKDRGVVLLIDSRFVRSEYTKLLPNHWHSVPIFHTDRLHRSLKEFWQKL